MGLLDDPSIIGVRVTLIDRCNSPRSGHYSFYKNNMCVVENGWVDITENETNIVLEAIDRAFEIAHKKEQERRLKDEYDTYLRLHTKFKNMDDTEIVRLQKSREAIKKVQEETDEEKYVPGSYL